MRVVATQARFSGAGSQGLCPTRVTEVETQSRSVCTVLWVHSLSEPTDVPCDDRPRCLVTTLTAAISTQTILNCSLTQNHHIIDGTDALTNLSPSRAFSSCSTATCRSCFCTDHVWSPGASARPLRRLWRLHCSQLLTDLFDFGLLGLLLLSGPDASIELQDDAHPDKMVVWDRVTGRKHVALTDTDCIRVVWVTGPMSPTSSNGTSLVDSVLHGWFLMLDSVTSTYQEVSSKEYDTLKYNQMVYFGLGS